MNSDKIHTPIGYSPHTPGCLVMEYNYYMHPASCGICGQPTTCSIRQVYECWQMHVTYIIMICLLTGATEVGVTVGV